MDRGLVPRVCVIPQGRPLPGLPILIVVASDIPITHFTAVGQFRGANEVHHARHRGLPWQCACGAFHQPDARATLRIFVGTATATATAAEPRLDPQAAPIDVCLLRPGNPLLPLDIRQIQPRVGRPFLPWAVGACQHLAGALPAVDEKYWLDEFRSSLPPGRPLGLLIDDTVGPALRASMKLAAQLPRGCRVLQIGFFSEACLHGDIVVKAHATLVVPQTSEEQDPLCFSFRPKSAEDRSTELTTSVSVVFDPSP